MFCESKTMEIRTTELLLCMEELANQGSTCVSPQDLYHHHMMKHGFRFYTEFKQDLDQLLRAGDLYLEDEMLYLPWAWDCEERAVEKLAEVLAAPHVPAPANLTKNASALGLCREQYAAVQMALSCRLSLVLGGAGTGKTTVIRSILRESSFKQEQILLCAPTGKAAQVLRTRTGFPAETVHGVLGVKSPSDFLDREQRPELRLIVVDEASMLTLPMFRAILDTASENCRVVLVGDLQQLPPIGCGDVLRDCLALEIPTMYLFENHRQDPNAAGLSRNLVCFGSIHDWKNLIYDRSFQFVSVPEHRIRELILEAAVARIRQGDRVMVLSPRREQAALSAMDLSLALREHLVPAGAKRFCWHQDQWFCEGDRVMLTANDREKGYWNGDLGCVELMENGQEVICQIRLDDGRVVPVGQKEMQTKKLAYALTIHKAQGSECDTVILPISQAHRPMLTREMLYTAFSRARKRVILIGDVGILDEALCRPYPLRMSRLQARVEQKQPRQAA